MLLISNKYMKKIGGLLALLLLLNTSSQAQRLCGTGIRFSKLSAENPAKMEQIRQYHEQLAAAAASNSANAYASKTAANYPIPVVFHFVLSPGEYGALGRDTGIKRRVNSQLASLNKDYTATNTDKSKVPSVWANLVDNLGITFGLANGTSANTIAAGIEVKVVTSPARFDVTNSCANAKYDADGLKAWDNTKYMNIWVVNIYSATSGTVLGVTTPPSDVANWGTPSDELGVVLNYGAIGVRESSAQYFIPGIDKGRTLTHELGHYFELWHTWGDDGGLCPTNGGHDDNVTDTPPQADATYCSNNTCPTFPKLDACSPSGNGVMFMNYMDYVDDASMYMFTKGQGAIMRAQFATAGSPSYSLTQQAGASHLAVIDTKSSNVVWSVYPNPTQGAFHLSLERAEGFQGAVVTNMMGQTVTIIDPKAGQKQYDISLADAPKGFYLVQCRYEEGNFTKKLVVE